MVFYNFDFFKKERLLMRVITAENMRILETKANENGLSYEKMMINAGENTGRVIERYVDTSEKITVLCGKGKNGGDGFVIAGYLKERGYSDVCVILALGENKNELCVKMREKYLNSVRICDYTKNGADCLAAVNESTVIIDAVFGIGFSGTIKGELEELFNTANLRDRRRFAVDIPSGVTSDGENNGVYFKAGVTVTMHAFKPAHVFAHNLCGETQAVSIGIDEDFCSELYEKYFTFCKDDLKSVIPERRTDANKGDFGKALILAGSCNMSGAAYFAVNGAVEAGAGIVYAGFPDKIYSALATRLSEPLILPMESNNNGRFSQRAFKKISEYMNKSNVTAFGPGIGIDRDTALLTEFILLNSKNPVIVDADGINSVSMNKDILVKSKCDIVMTPHPGEMARLTSKSVSEIQSDRILSAKSFAEEYGVTLVLKGANTVIASPDGRIFVNSAGNPGMARGGSGDVLTGIITAFISRGLTPFDASCAGVYIHSLAGDFVKNLYGENSVTPTRIIQSIGRVF